MIGRQDAEKFKSQVIQYLQETWPERVYMDAVAWGRNRYTGAFVDWYGFIGGTLQIHLFYDPHDVRPESPKLNNEKKRNLLLKQAFEQLGFVVTSGDYGGISINCSYENNEPLLKFLKSRGIKPRKQEIMEEQLKQIEYLLGEYYFENDEVQRHLIIAKTLLGNDLEKEINKN